MAIDERSYHEFRAEQEELLAQRCGDPRVQNAHQDFALAYRERINFPESAVYSAE